MEAGYGRQTEYVDAVKDSADRRQRTIEIAFREAFGNFIEVRETEVVIFNAMSALDLANGIASHPGLLKPLLAICNIAARAIERDLSIRNLDTYKPRLTKAQAQVIAGYLKPFLPAYAEIPTLSHVDRVAFVDKEIRKFKGQWELTVVEALNRFGGGGFRKRKFKADDEEFEVDAASPPSGAIDCGVDIKRIEARRDIHKRCDEIVNKAAKLKSAFPRSRFGAVIYYPFIDEHTNVQNRLRSASIDGVVFASQAQESVDNAARMLLSTLGVTSK